MSRRIEELARGVFVFPHSVVEGCNAIVFGSEAVLAVDACMWPGEASAMVAFIAERDRVPNYLALTHGHPDHVFGGAAFTGVEVIAHRRHEEMVRGTVLRQAERSGDDPDELYARLAHPTTVFDDRVTVDLGGRVVELIHTPGHTPDSASLVIRDEGIIVGGDTVVTGIVPAVSDGDSHQLERTLRRLCADEHEMLIPGHGPVLRRRDAVREAITWAADYLAAIRERLAALDVADDPLAAAPYDQLVAGRFPRQLHGMERRHADVVAKIAAELRGG